MANQNNFKQNYRFRAPFGNGGIRQNQARGGYKGIFFGRPDRPSIMMMGTPLSMSPGQQGQHRQFINPNRPIFSRPRLPRQNFHEFMPPRHPGMTYGNTNRFNTPQDKNTSYNRQWKGERNRFQVSTMGCRMRQFYIIIFDDQFEY